jgi:hypothetical protein
MATMVKSLFQRLWNWESSLYPENKEMPQCGGVKQQVEGTQDSGIEDGEKASKYSNSASPWVHGLL